MELLKGEKLNQMLLNFVPLRSPSIRNLIVSLKHRPNNFDSINCILKLKALFGFDYIKDNCLPSQQVRQKVYLFKMFVDGVTSKFNLVQRMQLGDDLQNVWMMFNHIKSVQGWTTMACHVYDPIYCNMQSKDMKAQCILWRKMNIVVEERVGYTHFQGVHGGWCTSKLECCSHYLWDYRSYSQDG
jgi:hypothetical protein